MQERFNRAIRLWTSPSTAGHEFREEWLIPDCPLLAYSRELHGRLSAQEYHDLRRLLATDDDLLHQQARAFVGKDDNTSVAPLVRQLRGLGLTVAAAHSHRCAKESDSHAQIQQAGAAWFGDLSPAAHCEISMDPMQGNIPDKTTPASYRIVWQAFRNNHSFPWLDGPRWLTLRRLLSYVLGEPDAAIQSVASTLILSDRAFTEVLGCPAPVDVALCLSSHQR